MLSQNNLILLIISLVIILFLVSVSVVECDKKETFSDTNNLFGTLNNLKDKLTQKLNVSEKMLDQQRQDKKIIDIESKLNCLNRVLGGSNEKC